mmetsp:Transcript_11873/g.11923  ORF Transcript_11873/g.11923 Transcript_11873/m.11923 type:complete len:87 (+) Transcript_11873:58-318(+)
MFQKFSQNLFTLAVSPNILMGKYIEDDDNEILSLLLVIQKKIEEESESNISLSPELIKKIDKFKKKLGKAGSKKTTKAKKNKGGGS